MKNLPNITRCGLPGVDLVPVGMHACHFYSNSDELVGALVPYILAGLRAQERCVWITAPPLPARSAIQALRAKWTGVNDAMETGALRVQDFDKWYANEAGVKGLDVVELWLEEERRALAEGYAGLRIAGSVRFLQTDDWTTFIEYEKAVSARFDGRRIVALCSYAHAQCNEQQMSEVLQAHHCAFELSDSNWNVVVYPESSSGSPQADRASSMVGTRQPKIRP